MQKLVRLAAKKAARNSTYPLFLGTLEHQHIFYYYHYYYYLFIYIYQVLTTLPSFSLFPKTLLFPTIRQVSTWNNHGTLEQTQLLLVLPLFSADNLRKHKSLPPPGIISPNKYITHLISVVSVCTPTRNTF
jgi:hypothetical protein